MQKPTLVVMAAGMGSRFGGLKQITPVDPQGHFLMDYSIFDALRAGFGRIVCIIKPDMQADFEDKIGRRVRPHAELSYAYQSLDMLPEGFSVPARRVKPWGTGHAVLCAAHLIDGPFAVLNADDFYGFPAFDAVCRFLQADHSSTEHAMVAYDLENTLTDHGAVTRGVCQVSKEGYLTGIVERRHIEKRPNGAAFTEDGETFTALENGTVVSMNFWGYQHSVLGQLENLFRAFLSRDLPADPMKAEFLLPTISGWMLQNGRDTIRVLRADARWFGVTYKEDLPCVMASIAEMKRQGLYPETLWK